MEATFIVNLETVTNKNGHRKEGKLAKPTGTLFYMSITFIATFQGGFIAPHVWEIVGRKNLIIVTRLLLFMILYGYFHKFSENREKEFKLGPMYYNFLVMPMYYNFCITSYIWVIKNYKWWSWNSSSCFGIS